MDFAGCGELQVSRKVECGMCTVLARYRLRNIDGVEGVGESKDSGKIEK